MSGPKPTFAPVVIRASAGTGKTYQLSNRFLGLLASGEPLDAILATTFTRKAAGEILSRVLVRLAEAAQDPDRLAQLNADLEGPRLDAPQCLALLAGVLRRLHRARVGTLDSFFIQVARSFALELGLPPGWQIVDEIEEEAIRNEAIRAVLSGESTSEVVRLMNLLTKGDAARSVHEQAAGLVRDLYSVYTEAPAVAWQSLQRHKPLADDELQAAVAALKAAPCPPDKRFERARQEAAAHVEMEDWESLLEKGLTGKVFQDEQTFYGKPIPPEMLEACRSLAEHARAVLLGRIANQTEATCRLLQRFDVACQRLKLARRALRFEDVTRMLAAEPLGERLEEVGYRLDGRVAHLLLDEFQDTAPLQWRVLLPFARRTAGRDPHASFFCVGDVKQAIYGWRGGVAEIFDTLPRELSGLVTRPLNKSFRSSPVVIDMVNRVFNGLAGNAALQNYPAAAQSWAARFQPHSTERSELPGYCRMAVPRRAGEGEDQEALTWEFAADCVRRWAGQAPGRSIGVLVRRNKAVAWLIRRLRQMGVAASEEGGNPLTDSPAVQWVLSLLTLADHPGHSAARFHVACSPLGRLAGLETDRDEAAACALSRRLRGRLMDEGYGPVLLHRAGQLAPRCDARELGRLMQLVEMGYAYEARATTRVDDFLKMVAQTRVEAPTEAAVRVMTVHQAKGLEFDLVVLPELDVRLTGQRPQIVVGRPDPAQDIQRVLRYVSSKLWHVLPRECRNMFQDHERRMVEESLCVLYVALTRARHAVEIVVAPSREQEKNIPATFAGMLRAALTSGARLAPESVAFEAGDPDWHGRAPLKRPAAAAARESPEPVAVRLAPSAARLSRGLERRSPSQLEGGLQVDLAGRLRVEGAVAAERGSVIHAWLALVEWLEDGEPDDAALRGAAGPLASAGLDLQELIRQFRAALQRPAVRAVLTRATFERPAPRGSVAAVHAGPSIGQPVWRVFRELPFAVREEDMLLSGRIDRLVVLHDGDRPVAADLLDFKTDAISPGDSAALEARTAFYRPQLAAYRRAAARLAGLPPERISARLVFTEPGVLAVV